PGRCRGRRCGGAAAGRAGRPEMILLAGGTGRLGTVLPPRLTGHGLAVRVLTRDPARAGHLAALGVEVATGDVGDRASLAPALEGAGVVVSAVHGFTGPGGIPGHRRLPGQRQPDR